MHRARFPHSSPGQIHPPRNLYLRSFSLRNFNCPPTIWGTTGVFANVDLYFPRPLCCTQRGGEGNWGFGTKNGVMSVDFLSKCWFSSNLAFWLSEVLCVLLIYVSSFYDFQKMCHATQHHKVQSKAITHSVDLMPAQILRRRSYTFKT